MIKRIISSLFIQTLPPTVSFLHEKRGVAGTSFYFKSTLALFFYRVSIKYEWWPDPKGHHTELYCVDVPDTMKEKSITWMRTFTEKDYVMPRQAFESAGMNILIEDGMCEQSGIPKDLCWLCENKDPGVMATESRRPDNPPTH